ncbi:helix-turn-helix domain-containing protein [Bacillus piscicola]|uniref:helix-turn-helix domain-containing protein n=1 Tax=Bacillus piscicola TaxID=1632684 RepID=UPI001F094FDF|nr:helix-turn-helix domain-containing protein [Bacillus piscicola]
MDKVWYKTKEVAERFEVSPGTVLKWTKKYEIPYTINKSGHYFFAEDQLEAFQGIADQGNNTMENNLDRKEQPISTQVMLNRLENTEEKLKMLEKMMTNKADDIIGFQMLEQRQEIRRINKRLQQIEERLEAFEEQSQKAADEGRDKASKKEKHFLASIFSV